MTVIGSSSQHCFTLDVRSQETLNASSDLDAKIYPFPLNRDLVLGKYGGETVYALGKTVLGSRNWLGLIRLGGFHLIFTDIQKISGSVKEVISQQLKQAESSYLDNPGFSMTLPEDVLSTMSIMRDGYLLPDVPVIDYVWFSCRDRESGLRMAMHPDTENEHVNPDVRSFTLGVASAVIGILNR